MPLDPQVAAAAEAIKTEFAADFPKFDPVQMFTLNIGAQQIPTAGGSPVPSIGGFNLTKLKGDGTPGRVFRAMSNVMSVHFLEYTSWKDTKPKAIDYIVRCLEKFPVLNRNSVTAVLLRYIDRFTFDGPPENATASKLFRADTQFIPSNLLDRGYQWHSTSGWYEPLVGTTVALNQLNIVSGLIPTAAGVNVDHNSICVLPVPANSAADLIRGDVKDHSLEGLLDRQHAANAGLLRNLLNPEMLKTIGL
jgi:uncharacterized protein (TIGR04255 family)